MSRMRLMLPFKGVRGSVSEGICGISGDIRLGGGKICEGTV